MEEEHQLLLQEVYMYKSVRPVLDYRDIMDNHDEAKEALVGQWLEDNNEFIKKQTIIIGV